MLNGCRASLSICAIALAIAGSARVASAQATVYIGYADGLRGSPFFPAPWFGDPSVQSFQGLHDAGADAGAIMIRNNTALPFTITAFSVDIGSHNFNLWTLPVLLNPGKDAIFTETVHYNFDTSDPPYVGTCSAPSSTVPKVNVTINLTSTSFDDTGLILTTDGSDLATCVPGSNEALGWRLIGTTGVGDPGNQVAPEPATIGLFGTGLLGLLAGFLRRRKD